MKRSSHSFPVAFTAAVFLVVTFVTLDGAPAAGQAWSESANNRLGKEQMLLGQADTIVQIKTDAAKKRLVNVDEHGVILKGYDPVAYFKQNRPVKGNPKYASKYEGATYYFESEQNKADFDKSPAQYAPQYGGFCANSVRKRKISDIDPNSFFIYKGKLYVCSGASAAKEFKANPDLNIQAADKNWDFYKLPSSPGFNREFGS